MKHVAILGFPLALIFSAMSTAGTVLAGAPGGIYPLAFGVGRAIDYYVLLIVGAWIHRLIVYEALAAIDKERGDG